MASSLGYLILYVPKVEEAMEFYEGAFGFTRRMLHESGSYGELETGPTALAFCDETAMADTIPNGFTHARPEGQPGAFEIGIVTDDVEAQYSKALAHGADPAVPPAEKPWGQTVSYVRDPNGFLVEICSKIGV